jgi:glyoxylase-like metal-dependent hydrolase (beta-lactamase superfamily II)
MIFRQLFDGVSSTYSYVLASRRGGEALVIDPVLDKVDRYLKLMEELDLRLVKAVDTHLHATILASARARPHALRPSWSGEEQGRCVSMDRRRGRDVGA